MNKCSIILSAGLLLFFTQSMAQDHIRAGVKGGFSLTNLRGHDKGIKPGLQLGAVAMLGANEPVFFQTELLLTQKGSWKGAGKYSSGLFYLEIPVMLGIEITENLFFHAGFQPSILLTGFLRAHEENGGQSGAVTRKLNRFDYSTLISAEYHFKNNLFLGIRYTHGFVPVIEYDEKFTGDSKLPVNRLAGIYLGFMLR